MNVCNLVEKDVDKQDKNNRVILLKKNMRGQRSKSQKLYIY